jgi:hypothetical protein
MCWRDLAYEVTRRPGDSPPPEFADRESAPQAAKIRLTFTRAMRLPTFETSGMTLLKRLTLMIKDGTIEHVFYPVFPPDQNPTEVMAWIAARSNFG